MQKGQTLITLLFFIVIAMTVTTSAIGMILINSRTTTKLEIGILAYQVAESGVENALLRLLRDPSYSGETLPVGDGQAIIQVTGTDPKTITSTGTVNTATRKIQVIAGYTNNILTVSSWKEIL